MGKTKKVRFVKKVLDIYGKWGRKESTTESIGILLLYHKLIRESSQKMTDYWKVYRQGSKCIKGEDHGKWERQKKEEGRRKRGNSRL